LILKILIIQRLPWNQTCQSNNYFG